MKSLNKYEEKLKYTLDTLMLRRKIKFPVFLEALEPSINKSSPNYKNVLKSKYMKHLRANYTIGEVVKMCKHINCDICLTHRTGDISEVDRKTLRKMKFVDLMVICEFLGVQIKWYLDSKEVAIIWEQNLKKT